MKLVYKVLITIGIVLIAMGGSWGLSSLIEALTDLIQGNGETLKLVISLVGALLLALPGWYVWKGTGIFPLNFMFFLRVIVFVSAIFVLPVVIGIITSYVEVAEWIKILPSLVIIGLGMIGLWIRS